MSEPRARVLKPLFDWRSAVCDSDLTPTERHVLLALSLYMNQRGGSAFPGSARLAHDTGLHVQTVKKALQSATAKGWLKVRTKGGSDRGGQRLATVYEAALPVDIDWESRTTGSPECADWESSLAGLVVQDYPISKDNSPKNSRAATQNAKKADPDCWECHGTGTAYYPAVGRDGPCPCTKERAASETVGGE